MNENETIDAYKALSIVQTDWQIILRKEDEYRLNCALKVLLRDFAEDTAKRYEAEFKEEWKSLLDNVPYYADGSDEQKAACE